MQSRMFSIVALCAFSGAALAGPVDFIVDPALSSIDLSIEVDVGVASNTDSDSSSLSGSLRVELDDFGNPTQITLHDLFVNIDDDLIFNWSFGFLGGADATLTGGTVTWGSTDAVVGPVPIIAGLFVLPDVPVALQGTMSVNYDIFLVGSGSEIINLADQGDFFSTINGTVSANDGTVTLTSTLPLDASTPLVDSNGNTLGTLNVTGSATIVASGTGPTCPADLTGDGNLDFFDISAFLNAYNAMDPIADFDNNGVFNFFDVSGFLNAFNAGCP